MTAQMKEGSRWQKFIVLFLAAFSVAIVCLWGFAGAVRPYPETNVSRISADASATARSYILRHPTDSTGWLAFAESALLEVPNGPPPMPATQALSIAATLAPVDAQVLRARALLAIRGGDLTAGLSHAANIAVLFPTESSDAFALLRAYSNHPAWPAFFQHLLDSGWSEAESFLLDSCQSGAALQTLLAVARPVLSRQALTNDTVTCIGTKAIAEGQVSTAYWLWVNAPATVPSPLGNVFNGDFERPVAGQLFDWQINAGGDYREGFAATVSLDDSRGSLNKVLAIRFNGRPLKSPIAQQFLALTPGRFVLSYNVREMGLSAPGAVGWTVRCVPTTTTPGVAPIFRQQAHPGWVRNAQEFVIPEGCTGQLLDVEVENRLQRSTGLRGSVFFDDLSIARR
jgi:hypothetical protein